MRKARRRKRRNSVRWLLLASLALFCLGVAGIIWKLPQFAEVVAARAAAQAGFETRSLTVDSVGLGGIALRHVALESELAAVKFSSGSVTWSPAGLLAGRVEDLKVAELEIDIDLTRPTGLRPRREPAMPDPVDWKLPLQSLEILGARVRLRLPGESHLFSADATAERRADGRIAFGLQVLHPDQRVAAEGVLNDNLDGEIRATITDINPELYLSIGRGVGLLDAGENFSVESGMVNGTVAVALERGAVGSVTGSFDLPALDLSMNGLDYGLRDLVFDVDRSAEGRIEGHVSARVAMSNASIGWRTNWMHVEADITDDVVAGTVEEFTYERPNFATRGTVESFSVHEPWAADGRRITAAVEVASLTVGDMAAQPFPVSIAGTPNRLRIHSEVIGIADRPIVIRELLAVVATPFAAEMTFWGELGLDLGPLLESGKDRVSLAEGADAVVPVSFSGTSTETDIDGTVEWSKGLSGITWTTPRGPIRASAGVDGSIAFDGDRLAASAALELSAIDQAVIGSGLLSEPLRFEWNIEPISFDDIAAAMEGAFTGVAIKSGLTVRTGSAETERLLVADVERLVSRESWNLRLAIELPAGTLSFDEFSAEGLRLTKTIVMDGVTDADLTALMDAADRMDGFTRLAGAGAIEASVAAQSIRLPDGMTMRWLDASMSKRASSAAPDFWTAEIVATAASLDAAGERIDEVRARLNLTNGIEALGVSGRLEGVIEGGLFVLDAANQIRIRDDGSIAGEGVFSFPEFRLSNSAALARLMPDASGLVVSATLSGHGDFAFDSGGDFEASAYLTLRDGAATRAANRMTLTGLQADLVFPSLTGLRTEPGQVVRFDQLAMGELAVTDGMVRFQLDGPTRVFVDRVEFGIFGGSVATRPFALFFPDPDLVVEVLVANLDAGEIARRFDLFDGEITGRLDGRIPFGLLAGQPIYGEGILRLDPDYPAKLSYNARGLFTKGLPPASGPLDLQRLGHDLLEDGLEDLDIESMEIRLFDRSLVNTPVRITIEGRSTTERAVVPIVLTTNVKGSVTEVLDFIYRLLAL